jgi:alkanesulfonate monooxygenase SsuD/methylene tetrahydromethanopterin reductase-like flavin-dependent oxidoreductase (luciferase family)
MNGLGIGVHVVGPTAAAVGTTICEADAAGLDTAWMTQGGVAADAAACFAAAAASGRADRIRFGTSIYPTFPRHPLALAASALAVDSLAPGRFTLGGYFDGERVSEVPSSVRRNTSASTSPSSRRF